MVQRLLDRVLQDVGPARASVHRPQEHRARRGQQEAEPSAAAASNTAESKPPTAEKHGESGVKGSGDEDEEGECAHRHGVPEFPVLRLQAVTS